MIKKLLFSSLMLAVTQVQAMRQAFVVHRTELHQRNFAEVIPPAHENEMLLPAPGAMSMQDTHSHQAPKAKNSLKRFCNCYRKCYRETGKCVCATIIGVPIGACIGMSLEQCFRSLRYRYNHH